MTLWVSLWIKVSNILLKSCNSKVHSFLWKFKGLTFTSNFARNCCRLEGVSADWRTADIGNRFQIILSVIISHPSLPLKSYLGQSTPTLHTYWFFRWGIACQKISNLCYEIIWTFIDNFLVFYCFFYEIRVSW